MCGIIGYCGHKEAMPLLMQGLRQLEYRGYDSSGLALLDNDKIRIGKKAGKLLNLEHEISMFTSQATKGIAHTRWATHGKVSDANSHPHASQNGKVAIVHNGIIDNYLHLREILAEQGYSFLSETDSEVCAHLIESILENGCSDPLQAVIQALAQVEGTYGLIVLFKDFPDVLIAARNGSPLIVGIGENEVFVASDASAFIGRTREAVYLEDGEIVHISADHFRIIDHHAQEISKPTEEIQVLSEQAEKGKFEHFFLKEIFEQPEAIHRAMAAGGRISLKDGTAVLGGLNLSRSEIFGIERIHILSMGTGYFAGMVAGHIIEELARIPVQIFDASEYRLGNPIVNDNMLFLAISQSGETADTILAVKEVKNKGGKVLGIINVVGSTLARLTDGGVYIHAGPEKSVASTKAFTSQITVLTLFGLLLGRMHDLPLQRGITLAQELLVLPKKIEALLAIKEHVQQIAKKYSKFKNLLFMGRGSHYPIALEAALKLKEISYIHAEGYSSGGLKHGPLALISPEFPSFFIAMSEENLEKDISNIQEVRARSGKVIVLTNSRDTRIHDLADDLILIEKIDDTLTPILSVVPLQLFAYYCAVELGCEVDQPRNLAKSVTVE